MKIKRKAYEKLLAWKKESNGKTALLIEGARRVGKSFLVKEFAQQEYRSFIYIDFSRRDPVLREIFEQFSADLDQFFSRLSLFFSTRLYPRESCIVFDEVQLYPPARELIKHLVADGRYDYIETGSLISIKRNVRDIVIPSEEEKLELQPIDFEEFLCAAGEEMTASFIRELYESRRPAGDAMNRRLMGLLRLYMVVGGMPAAASCYAESLDLLKVRRLQAATLSLYRDDIAKYAEGYEIKVRSIFDSIPDQLSRHERRFKLSALEPGARMRNYEEAFFWLADSKIANLCFNSADPRTGLRLNLDRTLLKCYMADTGLLVCMATSDDDRIGQDVLNALLYGKLGINEGMFFENLVAQMLRSSGHGLFFHSRPAVPEKGERPMEIDFLLRSGKKISPVEVKSAGYRSHASLDRFISKYSDRLGPRYIIGTMDLKREGELLYLPAYMAHLI